MSGGGTYLIRALSYGIILSPRYTTSELLDARYTTSELLDAEHLCVWILLSLPGAEPAVRSSCIFTNRVHDAAIYRKHKESTRWNYDMAK